mmetsp:Transcript_6711/g.12656  ORF Transcript_6711/g.12656 Transcript_6711/m.12656 type:complete len:119 (+) Transcript_6711:538-894(+)
MCNGVPQARGYQLPWQVRMFRKRGQEASALPQLGRTGVSLAIKSSTKSGTGRDMYRRAFSCSADAQKLLNLVRDVEQWPHGKQWPGHLENLRDWWDLNLEVSEVDQPRVVPGDCICAG